MKRASRFGTRALQLAFAVVWAGTTQRVAASELAIEWSAPEGCPSRAQLASHVSRLVGGAVQSNLSASTDVTHTERGYRARVRITSAAGLGERILENAQCDVLADSVALVIALSSASPDAPKLEKNSKPTERPAFTVSAQATALFGPLPNPAAGIGGAFAVEGVASLRFEVRGAYYGPQSTKFEQSKLGATFGLISFGARGCRVWSFGAFDLAPCIGADAHHIAARGFGGQISQPKSVTWWGPALGVFGRVRLVKAFAIYVAAEGVVPLSTQRFVFKDVGVLHEAPVIAVQLLVAPEVRF